MQELEKILEEINEIEDEYTNEDHDIMFKLGAAGIAGDIKGIIRKHMNEKVTTNDLISRQALLDDFRNTITENSDTFDWLNMIARQPTVNKGDGWISVEKNLPPNSKRKGSFCPKYQVMTKYGVTEGWYNPDVESWYVLIWFKYGTYKTNDIDFERGTLPKVVRMPVDSGFVRAWKQFPERYIPETQNAKKYEPEWKRNFRKKFERTI